MSKYPKWSGIVAFVVTLAMCGAVVQAQQTGKVRRIGFLDNSTASSSEVRLEAFRQQLRKLGWIEGKSITIDYRLRVVSWLFHMKVRPAIRARRLLPVGPDCRLDKSAVMPLVMAR